MLADRLSRTVGELDESMTSTEMECWFALMEVEQHEAEVEQRKAKRKS